MTSRACCKCGAEFTGRIDTCPICFAAECRAEFEVEARAKLEERTKDERERWKRWCGLPPLFLEKTFENFERKRQAQAFDRLQRYNWREGKSLVLLSPETYGLGKTHLVAALVNKLIETEEAAWLTKSLWLQVQRCPVYFVSEPGLLARLKATYQDDGIETEEIVYRDLLSRSLLIIDDVGKDTPKDYSFVQRVYFRVIDGRYSNKQRVILTTNLGFDHLENRIGGACADRLREMCGKDGFIVMKGQSYRR